MNTVNVGICFCQLFLWCSKKGEKEFKREYGLIQGPKAYEDLAQEMGGGEFQKQVSEDSRRRQEKGVCFSVDFFPLDLLTVMFRLVRNKTFNPI